MNTSDTKPKGGLAARARAAADGTPPLSDAVLTLPNLLSFLRIGLVPVIVVLFASLQALWAFWLFVFASLSDAADGFLAKRFNMRSRVGLWLDPTADKFLVGMMFLLLGFFGLVPLWLVVVIIGSDMVVGGGFLIVRFFFNNVGTTLTLAVGKWAKASQYMLLGLAMGVHAGALPVAPALWADIVLPVCVLVAVLTLASDVMYLMRFLARRTQESTKP